MHPINQSHRYARSSAFCILLCLFASPGLALECGDTLGPGTYEMEADLQCDLPPGVPSLRLSGGAKLNMHDHTLTCLADPAVGSGDGIWLEGPSNEVSGGNIEGCGVPHGQVGVAVRLVGNGNRVSKLNISGDLFPHQILVNIGGSNNVVQDVVTSLGDIAFAVGGRDNVLLHNQSLSATRFGFDVVGNHNRLTNNSAVSSDCSGYSVSGPDNVLTDNEGVGNLNNLCEGIYVIEAFRTILERNTARAGIRDGFTFAFGGNNVVRNNVATGNAGTGISVIFGDMGNEFVGNIATGNGQDLNDGNPDCDNNIWRDNQFETASACIQMICASGTRSLPVLNSPPAPQPISSAVTTSGSAPSPPDEGGGSGGGGGGGGAIDWLTLLGLTGLAGMVAARGSRPPHGSGPVARQSSRCVDAAPAHTDLLRHADSRPA